MDSTFFRSDMRTPFKHTDYKPQSFDSLSDISLTHVSSRRFPPSNRAKGASIAFASPRGTLAGHTFIGEDDDVTVRAQGFLLQEDPGTAACEHMFDDFFGQLRETSAQHHLFELVSRYERSCQDVVTYLWRLTRKTLPLHTKLQKTSDILLLIKSEQQTWRLIGSLYSDRVKCEGGAGDEEMIHDGLNQHLSELDLTTNLLKTNSSLRQAQLIVDWLEFNAEEQLEDHYNKVEFSVDAMGSCIPPEKDLLITSENALKLNTIIYQQSQSVGFVALCLVRIDRENSLHMLMKGQKSSGAFSVLNLVTRLDPDAPIREQGKRLADLDEEDDAKLLNFMYCCIRAGRVDKAQEVCKKVGQIWRAASLEGWRLYHDPNVKQLGAGGTTTEPQGNPNRDIWKRSCWKLSEDPKISSAERGVYAALSGNLDKLLPLCRSWSDQLWAHFRVYVDQNVETNIHDHFLGPRSLLPLPASYTDKQLTYEEIFSAIEASPYEEVRREALSRFSIIQKYIILNDTSGLVKKMSEWCTRDDVKPHPHLIRFMAHLILFFQTLGLQFDETECNTILTKYILLLTTERHNKLVALYVSKLPQGLQTSWYAKFLEGISESSERRYCLDAALDCNLDVASIRRLVVENIRTADSDDFMIDSDLQLDGSTTPADQIKINAVEWLTLEPAMLDDAIKQTNAIARFFLMQRKLSACRDVTKQLPATIIEHLIGSSKAKAAEAIERLPGSVSNAIREQLCIKAYLDAQDVFTDWFKHYHNAKPVKPTYALGTNFSERVAFEEQEKQYKVDVERWQQSLDYLSQLVEEKIYNILLFPNGGWMVDSHSSGDVVDETRIHQMELLRRICIPTLCHMLLKVLQSNAQHKKSLQLADLIASELYQLYKVFNPEDLRKLLQELRNSAISLLDEGKDPLGYPLYD